MLQRSQYKHVPTQHSLRSQIRSYFENINYDEIYSTIVDQDFFYFTKFEAIKKIYLKVDFLIKL